MNSKKRMQKTVTLERMNAPIGDMLTTIWIARSPNQEKPVGSDVDKNALISQMANQGYQVTKVLNDWN